MSLKSKDVLVKSIHQLRDSIRKKHRQLTNNVFEEEKYVDKQLKPIVDPLKQLTSTVNKIDVMKREVKKEKEDDSDESVETDEDYFMDASAEWPHNSDLEEDIAGIPSIMKEYMIKGDGSSNVYGVYFNPETGKWMIGNSEILIGEKNIEIGNQSYSIRPGLLELLFKAKPNRNVYDQNDLQVYKQILEQTGAHLDTSGRVKRNVSFKYKNIIIKLFPPKSSKNKRGLPKLKVKIKGRGMNMIHNYPNRKVQYVYWDNVNELIERLGNLVASKQAGHSGVDREILSIIEELREIGVIVGGELVI